MVAEYPIPHGLDVSVRITTLGDTKFVDVVAPMYVCKEWRTTFCFSSAFSDREILKSRELSTVLINAYGPT